MELYTLKINVTNQRLSFGENPPEIFSGDQSIDFVEFTFTDDSWNFPNIWAIFSRQKGASYQIALDDNKVMIPAEVMQKRGYVYIGLMATDGENVQTSSVLQYSIRQGAANVDTISPSPNIYEQFLADLDAYQEAIHNLENLAATADTLPAGSDATASFDNGVLELGIPKGDTGATGNGIQSISKTGTSGSVDTYTITYTNGQTATFTVTNGEVTQAAFDELAGEVSAVEFGESTQIQSYMPSTSFSSGIGNNIYMFSEKLIPAETVIESVEVQTQINGTAGYVFIVDENYKIVDKFYIPSASLGWNTISVGKRYDRNVYIAVRGMAVGYLYTNTIVDNLYSIGLYEADGNTYGARTIGQTIPFSQVVPTRFYQFAVRINVKKIGVTNITSNLLGVSELSDFTMPKMQKTGEQGYSLFGRWYKMSDSLSQCANCGGASIAFKVKGATVINVDIEQLVYHDDPAYMMTEEPYIAYSIDGSSFTRLQISTNAADSVKSIPISGVQEHFVWIVIDGMCQSSGGANRSTGWSGVYIKSLTTDGTMYKVKPAGKQILYVGDSMVEGIDTLGTNSLSSSNSNIAEWSFKSAINLHAFPLMQGYGGSTVQVGTKFELYSRPDYNVDTYIVDNKPDVIVCEYGHNDYTLVSGGTETSAEFIAAYRNLIVILSEHYPGVPIIIITPFMQRLVNEILSVANTSNDYYLVDTSGYDYQTLDGTHPSAESGTAIAKSFADDVIRILGKSFFI